MIKFDIDEFSYSLLVNARYLNMGLRHLGIISSKFVLFALIWVCSNALGQTENRNCLVDALSGAEDSTTVGEIRAMCQQKGSEGAAMVDELNIPVYERNVVEERFRGEREFEGRPFAITAHQPNYLLWSTVDSPNQTPWVDLSGLPDPIDDNEWVYQISIKAPIWRNVLGSNIDAYVAYTSRSWWQLGNDDISAPFRETNYQPEIFLRSFANHKFLGLEVIGWDFGFNHESNGRAEPLSRSWNRIMSKVGLQVTDDLNMIVRAWYRLPEDEEDDNNPGEYQYYGYGDVRAIWTPNRNTFTALVRPGTKHTSFELTWSYPISSVFRIYAQYYNGFGESLLDYDYKLERIGIGIAMTDFLGRN